MPKDQKNISKGKWFPDQNSRKKTGRNKKFEKRPKCSGNPSPHLHFLSFNQAPPLFASHYFVRAYAQVEPSLAPPFLFSFPPLYLCHHESRQHKKKEKRGTAAENCPKLGFFLLFSAASRQEIVSTFLAPTGMEGGGMEAQNPFTSSPITSPELCFPSHGRWYSDRCLLPASPPQKRGLFTQFLF